MTRRVFVLLAATLLLLLIVLIMALTRHREAFLDAPLRLLHVVDDRSVTLSLDADLGPLELPGKAEDALADLRGLDVVVGGGNAGGLVVGDAAQLSFENTKKASNEKEETSKAANEDRGASASLAKLARETLESIRPPKKEENPTRIVAPLGGPPRALWLLSPKKSETSETPKLGPWVGPIRVHCGSEFEAALYRIAHTLSGNKGTPTVVVHKGQDRRAAAAAAALEDIDKVLSIVPVWCCEGAPAIEQVSGVWNAALVPYHPSDDPSADGRTVDAAPHLLATVAPTLRTTRTTLELISAPTLVLLPDTDDELTVEMARRVSSRLLRSTNKSSEGWALMNFYEAQGLAVVVQGREGFQQQQPLELVPSRRITGIRSFVTDHYDQTGEGPWDSGVREIRLDDRATIEGVRPRRGDRVELTQQGGGRPKEQNGSYIAVGVDIHLQSPLAIDPAGRYQTYLERVGAQRRWVWRFRVNAVGPEEAALRRGDRVAWLPLPGAPHGEVVAADLDGFDVVVDNASVLRSAAPEASKTDRDTFHKLSTCSYKAPTKADAAPTGALTRWECEAVPGAAWDRPCERDADCPFFVGTGTELDGRGGCMASGRCEVPVGVSLVGWRHAGPEKPICRCDGATASLASASAECCARSSSGVTKRPAFELDGDA